MKKYFAEGYGCSLNKADTMRVQALVEKNGFEWRALEGLGKGDIAVINTCAVKQRTENRMINRIGKLEALAKKQGFELIVFGCLSKINPKRVQKISKTITIVPPNFAALQKTLKLENRAREFEQKSTGVVSIIPIARGCLGECSYCAVRNARGKLRSRGVGEIKKFFEKELRKGKKEFWLTAQDCACYGFDVGSDLGELLGELLQVGGEYRIRIGMLNVQHLKKFFPRLLRHMEDERVYKFLHVPMQSGSNRVLKLMNRGYSAKEWLGLAEKARKKFPEITLATDIIAGFPTETEKEFFESVRALERARVDVVNVSRYGSRPGTRALDLEELKGGIKKQRTRFLAKKCKELSLERNKEMVGRRERVLVAEKGKKHFVGRTSNYKACVVRKGLGEFVGARVVGAKPTYLLGGVESSF